MKKLMIFVMLAVVSVPLLAQDSDPSGGLNIWTIISGALAVVSAIFGNIVIKGKKKIGQVIKLGMEAVDVADAAVSLADSVSKALEDNVITDSEKADFKAKTAELKKEVAEAKAQWKIVWNKNV